MYKKIFIIFIIIFSFGFLFTFINLTQEYQKCINKEYSTYENNEGQDFNEWWLEIHDNFSTTYKIINSLKSGLLYGGIGVTFFLYVFLLYKLFSSKNMIRIIVGFIIFFITLFFIWFFVNFKIQ